MNIFKREMLIYRRSRLFQILYPLTILCFSLWIFLGLRIFESNNLDILSIYNMIPIIFSIIIPLISYNFWQRERALGLDEILLNRDILTVKIIVMKLLSSTLFVSIILILNIPIIMLLSLTGFIDYGQVISINIGLFLFIIYGVSITSLLSLLIKSRVVNIITNVIVLILSGYGNRIILTLFSGIIEFNHIIYTIAITTLFIIISSFILNKKFNIKLALVSLVVVILSLFIPGSIDITSLRSHTITDYSKEVINNSRTQFDLTYYYSEDLLSSSDIPFQVIRLINQFNKLDNFSVKISTDKDDDFFENVVKYQPGSLEGGSIYNFIVLKNSGYIKVIPFIPYIETLEFEIMKVVNYFLNNGLKDIGIYIGNDEFTEDNFTALKTALSEHFNTQILFPGDIIPTSLDSLFVIGVYDINSTYVSEIGHYLSHGGNLIIGDTGLPTSEELNYRDTPLLSALKSLGVEIEPYLISVKGNTEDYDLNIVTYANRAITDNSIISPFTGFLGIFTSPVLVKNDKFDNLLYTSKDAWLVDSATGLEGQPENEFPVAAYGVGFFSEYFNGGQSNVNNKLMVIGNSMSFTDYIVGIAGDNSFDFIIRSLYTMVDYEDLMNIRHKYNWEKTLIKVERDTYRETKLLILKVLILFIYPLILLFTTSVVRKKSF